jgi:hypothetical protein
MARITYEPPIIYQLGLIEIMKILQETKVDSGKKHRTKKNKKCKNCENKKIKNKK